MLRHHGNKISRLNQFRKFNSKNNFFLIFLSLVIILFILNPFNSEKEDTTPLEELKVITKISPNTYIESDDGPNGFEYALLEKFSKYIGKELKIITTDSLNELTTELKKNNVDFASAALSKKTIRSNNLIASQPYLTDQAFLIYNVGKQTPREINDLINKDIVVISDSDHSLFLQEAKISHPSIHWKVQENIDLVDLFNKINLFEFDYTIANKKEFVLHQGFFPKLKMSFKIGEPSSLCWAFSSEKSNLLEVANNFLTQMNQDGSLEKLEEQYYGQAINLKQQDANEFSNRIKNSLPELIDSFKLVASRHNISWQLLAAISYQESRWNTLAKSRTGVRGLMMLTLPTAKEVGVTNRLDPMQSLDGGAKYFLKLKKRLPKNILEPDRTWFALAAYNVGLGHLEDARIITESRGGDPDSWYAVKQSLPLLTQKKWYLNTKFGYARGYEPVQYVQNIRQYYNVLNNNFLNRYNKKTNKKEL